MRAFVVQHKHFIRRRIALPDVVEIRLGFGDGRLRFVRVGHGEKLGRAEQHDQHVVEIGAVGRLGER